jgi:hypothetical protein
MLPIGSMISNSVSAAESSSSGSIEGIQSCVY